MRLGVGWWGRLVGCGAGGWDRLDRLDSAGG